MESEHKQSFVAKYIFPLDHKTIGIQYLFAGVFFLFAGGFMAHVARTGDLAFANLRRAMVYGSALGSLAVEAFGVQRLEHITLPEVHGRVKAFRDLVHFSLDGEE